MFTLLLKRENTLMSNSPVEVTKNLNIDREYVTAVIKRRGSDELHKLLRSGYLQRTKHK
jgi:predicted DNA-binding ArsR family transcriptional regulator